MFKAGHAFQGRWMWEQSGTHCTSSPMYLWLFLPHHHHPFPAATPQTAAGTNSCLTRFKNPKWRGRAPTLWISHHDEELLYPPTSLLWASTPCSSCRRFQNFLFWGSDPFFLGALWPHHITTSESNSITAEFWRVEVEVLWFWRWKNEVPCVEMGFKGRRKKREKKGSSGGECVELGLGFWSAQ